MMSHKQQKRLAKNHFEAEAAIAESFISPTPTPKSRPFKSFPTSTNRVPRSTRLLNPTNHRGRNLSDTKCLSTLHRASWEKLKTGFGSISNMATHSNHGSPLLQKTKRATGQKKEELEREVSALHKMLDHEQKMHQYLEQLNQRKEGSNLAIPSFVPQKMKEILVEMAMVETEITRLESQIKQLKSDVKHEEETNVEAKYKEWGRGAIKNRLESSPLPPHPNRRPNNEKTAFDPKGMHFISKAIKGEYHRSSDHFSNNPKLLLQEEVGGIFREKVMKKSGMLKLSSPLRERRNPTPRRDRGLEVHAEIPPKALSTPTHSDEDNIQRWPPNKLSENIIKCLFFIFARLLRSSRVMELEKSGPVARFANLSLSFRADTSLNSFQKDSRQQDPYGIFDSEESIPRDIGPYKNLTRFTSTSMDMKYIQNSSSIPLFKRLKLLMDGLQKVDLRFLSHQQKLAFWINIYNACIMHGYLQYGVPSICSPDHHLALVNKATLNIAGNTINAQAIEHFILRKPEAKLIKQILGTDDGDSKPMIVHELYGLDSPDPRIAFALCCGTRSSPAAKVYTAEGVGAELERSKVEYLQAAIMVKESKRVAVPELLVRNMRGFAEDEESLVEWICNQLPTSCTLRKSMVDCFRGVRGVKGSGVVERMGYEFEFQYLLAM